MTKTKKPNAKKAVEKKDAGKKKAAKKDVPQLTEEMIEEMTDKMNDMIDELDDCMKKNAAAKRARKASSELTKLFKDFRAASVAFYKKD